MYTIFVYNYKIYELGRPQKNDNLDTHYSCTTNYAHGVR